MHTHELWIARRSWLVLLLLVLALPACSILSTSSKPTVIVNSPPSGSQFREGEDVAIQTTSTDPGGIVRVELIVDGSSMRTDAAPSPQVSYTLIQTWKATAGTHVISVRAYNNAGAVSDPAAISISIQQTVAQGPTATLTVNPPTVSPATPTITPTTSAPPPGPGPCTNNAAFVADITVPDGTNLAAGQAFNKIWRISNTGSCAWGPGYQFVFTGSGEAMSAYTAVNVPTTNPGATADILVPMAAPAAAGPHSGGWRVRSSGGAFFGQTVSVRIITLPAGCTGTPNIASFTASTPSIPAATSITVPPGTTVTLSWGAVTGAESAEIDQGIGGIETPGSRTVSPSSTTVYTLTARCGSTIQTRQVTVNVTAAGNFGGHWVTNFGTLDITQSGASVAGTYSTSFDGVTGTIAGIVTGNTLNGTYQKISSGTIQFTLGGGGQTFDGNWTGSGMGTNKWCGARSGVNFANGCSYSGAWMTDIPSNHSCAMNLTRKDNSVTGTYCNGTLNGTISFTADATKLTGTWHVGPSSGALSFYLLGYDGVQFQGNYGTTFDWCGWRGGALKPSPCLRQP